MNKPMKTGLNVFHRQVLNSEEKIDLVTDNGKLIDFAVCHVDVNQFTKEESVDAAHRLSEYFEKRGVHFITNYEFQNTTIDCKSADGFEWADNSDGCHRLKLYDGYVKALSESEYFDGIMYDEFEHMIVSQNPSIQINTKLKKILPVFPLSDTKDPVKQGEVLRKQLKEYADGFRKNGAPAMLGEHVFAVMLHTFAECGIIPNYKSMKEDYSNVGFAIAAGAAMEYNMPLYNCVDNWFRMTHPGHSPEELYHNLVFAQKAGVDCCYVESISVMTDNEGKITPLGESFRKFCKEYTGKERDYSIEDYRPEIGIIRYDDGFWGQWYPVIFKKCLNGNPKLKVNYKSYEMFRIFNIITHGETCKNGISWARFSPYFLRKHFSFVSMNSTAVFDHKADERLLDSLKLCFLCGIHISEDTLKAVEKCVKEKGLTAVTPKRFAPESIRKKAKGSISEIADGNGKWIVVRNYKSSKIKKHVREFLGNKGEIRLTFKNREIKLKINEDRDSFAEIS